MGTSDGSAPGSTTGPLTRALLARWFPCKICKATEGRLSTGVDEGQGGPYYLVLLECSSCRYPWHDEKNVEPSALYLEIATP